MEKQDKNKVQDQAHIQIGYDEWEEKYKPVENTLEYFGGQQVYMFDTSRDLEHVKKNQNFVWTLVDGDDELVIIPGLHYVNRFGYYITEIPPEHENITVLFESD